MTAGTRKRGQARDAILASARELFGRHGYHGTTVRQVAQHARVSEAILYRYFASKQALFQEAVTDPYRGFVDSFIAEWEALGERVPNDEMVARFVVGLYAFAREHRDLLFALTTASRSGDGEVDQAGVLSDGVRRLARYTARQAKARGIAEVDLEMAVTCTVALVLSVVLHDDILFPAGRAHPAHERILGEMVKYAAAGVQQRDQSRQASGGTSDGSTTGSVSSMR